MKFNQFHNIRKHFIKDNCELDHIVVEGTNNVLISAPHGVSQIRLGKYKLPEIGALATALLIKQETNCFFIAKTKNNNDDANFDEVSPYKTSIEDLIKNNNIKYIIDFHGLDSKRECDINLGTHLGNNIKNDESIFNKLYQSLIENNFVTQIDQPYMAGSKTISGSMANKYPNVWTLQIEINCGITNKPENFHKLEKLITILTNWIKSIPQK